MGLSGLATKPSKNNKFTSDLLPGFRSGIELLPPGNQRLLVEAFKSWVYICVNRNSNVFASCPLRLYVNKPTRNSKTYFKTRSITKKQREFFESNATFDQYTRKEMIIEEVIEHPSLELFKNVNGFRNRNDVMYLTNCYQDFV